MCILPFNSVSISASGELRVCCNSGKDLGYNLSTLNIDTELLNNKKIIEIRSDFINGVENPICDRCWDMEKFSDHSFRTTANDNFSIDTNTVVNFSETIDFENLQYLDITLGNKCNLACRMCSPYSSSLVAKQWTLLNRYHLPSELIEFDQQTKEKILEVIKRAKNLTHVYMLGGEPLVSDFHDEIVEYFISSGRSKHVHLHYNTNLQIDVARKLDQWSHFKQIDLSVSIDGVDETYEYIRWPGKWSKVENNLLLLKEYLKSHSNIRPNIATTVQNLNVDNLHLLIDRMKSISGNDFSFYFIPVTFFNELEITPTHVLAQALIDLSKFDDTGVHKLPDLKRLINSAIEKKSLITSEKVTEFFRWQESYDGLRGQNLFKTKPYFESLADEYGIKKW